MFWTEEKEAGRANVYSKLISTQPLYLGRFCQECRATLFELHGKKSSVNIDHTIMPMAGGEKSHLRHHCIIFLLVYLHLMLLSQLSTLLPDFRHHTWGYNLFHAEKQATRGSTCYSGPAGDGLGH